VIGLDGVPDPAIVKTVVPRVSVNTVLLGNWTLLTLPLESVAVPGPVDVLYVGGSYAVAEGVETGCNERD
jgi:hypothetical protein